MRCSLVLVLILVCLALTQASPTKPSSSSPQTIDTTEICTLHTDLQLLKFGDIVSVPLCGVAKHFAIYVRNETIEGISRNLEDDFFHRQKLGPSGCVFKGIPNGRIVTKATNYDLTTEKTSKEEIIKRIKEKVKDCGSYKPLKNNCEHTVTYIRFGLGLTLQDGTWVSGVKHICTDGVKNCNIYDDIVKNAEAWEQCVKNNNNVVPI